MIFSFGFPIDGFSQRQILPGRSFEGTDWPERPGESRQQLPEFQKDQKKLLEIPLPAPPAPQKDRLYGQIQVNVKNIKLVGNKVFSDKQLDEVVSPYQGRIINSEDLFQLRNAITLFYVNRGYINSGAVIPDQKVADGVIEIQIVEGQLTEFNVSGNDWLRESYITKRLQIGSEDILNLNRLQDRIKLLHQDRLVDRVNAELSPGDAPGQSVLNVQIEESRPYSLGVSYNNYRSPSVGEYQGEFYASLLNVTGFGDSLDVRYSLTEGLDNGAASYSFPITANDTRLQIFYEHTDADVIEDPFDFLNIHSETESYGASISHPFYQTPHSQFLATFRYEERSSDTTLRNPGSKREPFTFSGVDNGHSEVTVLRFLQEWTDRSSSHVLALRSTVNWGIRATKLIGTDGNRINRNQFFSWLGQFQWVKRLGNTDIQLLLRGDVQLTPDPLLPLEKFAVGGTHSVRGYRENQLVRDNGAIVSLEMRYPIIRLPIPWLSESVNDGNLQLAAFYDFGWSENNDQLNVPPTTISSAGIGLRWDPSYKIHGQFYWGIPLRKIDRGGEHSLQDSGIHFSLNVNLL